MRSFVRSRNHMTGDAVAAVTREHKLPAADRISGAPGQRARHRIANDLSRNRGQFAGMCRGRRAPFARHQQHGQGHEQRLRAPSAAAGRPARGWRCSRKSAAAARRARQPRPSLPRRATLQAKFARSSIGITLFDAAAALLNRPDRWTADRRRPEGHHCRRCPRSLPCSRIGDVQLSLPWWGACPWRPSASGRQRPRGRPRRGTARHEARSWLGKLAPAVAGVRCPRVDKRGLGRLPQATAPKRQS